MTAMQDVNGEIATVSPSDGHVRFETLDRWTRLDYTPAQARELAAALLRAADEAEGVTSASSREYEAGESSGYADWAFAFMDIVPDDVDESSPSAVAAWVRRKLEESK